MEVKRKSLSRRHSTLSNNSGLTLPHRQEIHVSSVMPCHVMGGHLQHLVANDVTYVLEMYCKVKVESTCVEY